MEQSSQKVDDNPTGIEEIPNEKTKEQVVVLPKIKTNRNEDIKPVSYTHLDVYKRQRLYRQEGGNNDKQKCQNQHKKKIRERRG